MVASLVQELLALCRGRRARCHGLRKFSAHGHDLGDQAVILAGGSLEKWLTLDVGQIGCLME